MNPRMPVCAWTVEDSDIIMRRGRDRFAISLRAWSLAQDVADADLMLSLEQIPREKNALRTGTFEPVSVTPRASFLVWWSYQEVRRGFSLSLLP